MVSRPTGCRYRSSRFEGRQNGSRRGTVRARNVRPIGVAKPHGASERRRVGGRESAANTAIVCQMGNVAWRTGRKVHWDAAAGRFKGDAEANALIAPRYRAPYRLPA